MIAIWSSSSPANKTAIKKGLQKFSAQKLSFKTISKSQINSWAKAESKSRRYLAASEQEKLKKLCSHLSDKCVTDIFCTRGGYGAIRLLPLLDKVKLYKQTPKTIWGYSDTTVIQHYFHQRFGWKWVHSPMLCSESFHSPNAKETKAWNKINTSSFQNTQRLKIISKKKTSSQKTLLLGGNLACLCSMIGTPWELVSKKKFLLFLEDIAEAPYKIDRYLQQLIHSKMFKNCSGILLGHFTRCPDAEKVIKLWADENKLFCASGIEAGHESPHLPLAMGEKVELKIKSSRSAELKLPALSLPSLKM